ncbi:MAG: hypothetical protein II507_00210 [Treponema sp.]|nr:hypothetical protein [Treponema sp.]
MKKLITGIAIVLATALIGTAAFAIEYDGDVQVNLGLRDTSLKADDIDDKSGSLPTIGIENYNLFKLNDIFSAGFMESISFGTPLFIDDDTSIKFLVGPAASAKLGSIVKLQAGAGLAVAKVKAIGDEKHEGQFRDIYLEYSFTGIGFGLDLQAKFLPEKTISPIVGFRYTYVTSGNFDVKADNDDDGYSWHIDDETINANFINVYLGASYNF